MLKITALAMSVLGLCLGSSARADDAEDKAVAIIWRDLRGRVTRDEKAPGKPVIEVTLQGTKVTDTGLKELAPLKNLTTLILQATKVTDSGLKELAHLKNLTTLHLQATPITDAGLKELAPLKNLTTLMMVGLKVTDAGLKELATLRNATHVHPRVQALGREVGQRARPLIFRSGSQPRHRLRTSPPLEGRV